MSELEIELACKQLYLVISIYISIQAHLDEQESILIYQQSIVSFYTHAFIPFIQIYRTIPLMN
jgi:hypothetical protein